MATQAGVLWMGSLERYMDENYIKQCFNSMGEVISGVKMMKNKFTGEPAGYCFVQFPDDFSALTAMHKLNNKMIPNSQPPTKFRLNHTSLGGKSAMDRDYSLWIGDLSPDVDDYILYKGFASRYPSVRLAKVILDSNGFSKGYGFVRFADEDEQKDALLQMNGFKGVGSKALRVSIAINRAGGPKANNPLQGQAMAAVQAMWSGNSSNTTPSTGGPTSGGGLPPQGQQDYSQYYEQYYQNYAAWQNYGSYYNNDPNAVSYASGGGYPTSGQIPAYAPIQQQQMYQQQQMIQGQQQMMLPLGNSTVVEDEYELVEHTQGMDIDHLNTEALARSNDLLEALDESRWLPRGTLQLPMSY